MVAAGLIAGITLTGSVLAQYLQLAHYRNLAINEIDLYQIDDGYYTGKVDYGFEYTVGVEIENHTIKNIDVIKNRDNFYARLAEGIRYKIAAEQKINLDAVTGATTTSMILLKAIETAIPR